MTNQQRDFINDTSQSERRRASTYHQYHLPDEEMGGRYQKLEPQSIVGGTPIPEYPAGAPWTREDAGLEPPLGWSVEEQTTVGEPHEVAESLTTGATHILPFACLSEEDAPPPASPPHSPHSVKGESGASSDHLRRRASATNFKRRI
jgi:hypothetical protein